MAKESAGLLIYRRRGSETEVLLVHPGGPFWAKKDDTAWSFPKGELAEGEDPVAAAQREFTEETGFIATGPFVSLGTVRQAGGKLVHAFAGPGDFDPACLVSNTFEMEWPPRSGRRASFPEVDRAAWFTIKMAATKLHRGLADFPTRLQAHLR